MNTNTVTKTDLTVANEISRQIGRRAFFMMGSPVVMGEEDAISFKIKGSKKFNYVKVALLPSDTYEVTFMKIRKFAIVVKEVATGIYNDGLHQAIECHTGLALSL